MMRSRNWRRIGIILFLPPMVIGVGSTAAFTAPVPQAKTTQQTIEQRPDDRLLKRVTIRAERTSVGELLEEISQQSGVTLTADERTGAGDDMAAVFLRDVPLSQAMEALVSLLSFKQAGWQWVATDTNGERRYMLIRPRAARSLADDLRRMVQVEFEREAETAKAALSLSPNQLTQAAKNNRTLGVLQQSERRRDGLQLFFQTLSSEAQGDVLRQQGPIRMPVSQLSPAGQAFVNSEFTSAGPRDEDGKPHPPPQTIEFRATMNGDEVAPTLFIFMGEAGGVSYIGGPFLQEDMSKRIVDRWNLAADSDGDPAAARVVEAPKKSGKEDVSEDLLSYRLGQLAGGAPLSLMTFLPGAQKVDPGSPFGKTVEQYLERLEGQKPYLLRHKWRSNILLLRNPLHMVHEEEGARVPWTVRRKLRQMEQAAPDGRLSIGGLAQAAVWLSEPQLQRLGEEEMPVMSQVARLRGLFALLSGPAAFAEQALSTAGVPLAEVLPALRRIPEIPVKDILEKGGTTFRVIEKPSQNTPAEHVIQFRAQNAAGEVVWFAALWNKGRQTSGGMPK